MRIVITGATGLIGRALARRLVHAGHQVVALSRDPAAAAHRLPARCQIAAWAPATGTVASDVLRGTDAVIHLAGEGVADRRWTPRRKQAIRDSRVETTRALVHALASLPTAERPPTFVGASAIGIYGERGDEPLDELSPGGSGFLADVCRQWELATLAASDLGLRTVVVRIGVVLGREGGALAHLLPVFRLGLGARLGTGRQWMSWIHLDDVVGLLSHAATHPGVAGVVNAVAPAPVRNTDFTRQLATAVHRPTALRLPAAVVRLLLGESATVVLSSQRVLPAAAESLGFHFAFPHLETALDDLCADPAHEVVYEQWLPRTPEVVFPFFADAYNLEQITPPFLRFRVRGLSTPAVEAGTYIDYRLRLHGIPLRWQSRIDQWEPNHTFVDFQTRGPYALWHHTHVFTPADGGTVMRDRVRYRLPLGALGDLVAGARVARDVDAIFRYRWETIAQHFRPTGASTAPVGAPAA